MFERLKQLQQLKEQYMKEGKEIFKSIFKDFITTHPDISELRWKQYTPYFNDGDPCEFRLTDLAINFNYDALPFYIREDSLPDSPEAYEDIKDDYDGGMSYYSLIDGEFKNNFRELESYMHKNMTILESIFGNDVQIVVTKDGIDISDYTSHD